MNVDVLVVGGGTGGTCAAIQSARRGAKTLLVSEYPWLGGMLTSAGVCAPDGNELLALQTGLWGAFLRSLDEGQVGGLDNAWVSFFTYDPRLGAKILADWVRELPCLQWISDRVPLSVIRSQNQVIGVEFKDFTVKAKIVIDATELGDLLALGDVPYRWGWEFFSQWNEPSAPISSNSLTEKYCVQAPTWVFFLRDFGDNMALSIPATLPMMGDFTGAWQGYGKDKFLSYGRLPGGLFMINWPQSGNDYGQGLDRLIGTLSSREEFLAECFYHSQSFAYYLQGELGSSYGLALDVFPHAYGAYALHPYFRESRRLKGIVTITEHDILPVSDGLVGSLPRDESGLVSSIAIGNYPNDHHYPNERFPLKSKSMRWGGRWTGTPFMIAYGALIPESVDGFLVAEKNISVSHIANGATRLQPVVMGIGQAAGMAAALCVEHGCQPRELSVRLLQNALLEEPIAPAAVVPLLNLNSGDSNWCYWQKYALDYDGEVSELDSLIQHYKFDEGGISVGEINKKYCQEFRGFFWSKDHQDYNFTVIDSSSQKTKVWKLVTLSGMVNQKLLSLKSEQEITILARVNQAGYWLLVEDILSGVYRVE